MKQVQRQPRRKSFCNSSTPRKKVLTRFTGEMIGNAPVGQLLPVTVAQPCQSRSNISNVHQRATARSGDFVWNERIKVVTSARQACREVNLSEMKSEAPLLSRGHKQHRLA